MQGGPQRTVTFRVRVHVVNSAMTIPCLPRSEAITSYVDRNAWQIEEIKKGLNDA